MSEGFECKLRHRAAFIAHSIKGNLATGKQIHFGEDGPAS